MADPLLIICHEATRTGGPRVALELFRRVRAELDAPLAVRLLAEGPLAEPLLALGDVDHVGVRPAAVFVNSALAADQLAAFDPEVPALVYVHEEGDALATLASPARTALVESSARVLCVSAGARRDLERMGVDPHRIGLLAPLVVPRDAPGGEAVEHARAEMGAPPGSRVVLGCGEANWRKGADLFVDVARLLRDRADVHFAWVGRRPRAFGRVLEHDTRLVGQRDGLRWLGEVEDTLPFLAAADVLVSTSREDPQPLVPLEAALVGTPTAAFAVGGLRDLADADAARAVEFPDTPALARAVTDLLDDAGVAGSTASAARARTMERHVPEVTVPRFLEELRALLEGRTPDRPDEGSE